MMGRWGVRRVRKRGGVYVWKGLVINARYKGFSADGREGLLLLRSPLNAEACIVATFVGCSRSSKIISTSQA